MRRGRRNAPAAALGFRERSSPPLESNPGAFRRDPPPPPPSDALSGVGRNRLAAETVADRPLDAALPRSAFSDLHRAGGLSNERGQPFLKGLDIHCRSATKPR